MRFLEMRKVLTENDCTLSTATNESIKRKGRFIFSPGTQAENSEGSKHQQCRNRCIETESPTKEKRRRRGRHEVRRRFGSGRKNSVGVRRNLLEVRKHGTIGLRRASYTTTTQRVSQVVHHDPPISKKKRQHA